MGNPIKRSKKEEYLEYNAKLAWASVMKELYFPPLQEPRYLFDYSLKEGFYIDHQKGWTITLNLANTPLFIEDKDYINYFRAIMLHEVYHYQLIPYDGLTNAVLLKAASKHISQVLAPIIVNLFSDLVIDTKLRENHHQLIEWELNQTYNHVIRINNGIICEFSIFVFKIYEKLWKIELNIKPNEELDQLADKVSIIVLKDFDNELKWEIKISKIALLLKNLIDDTFIISKKNASNIQVQIPCDIIDLMGNPIEIKNSDLLGNKSRAELQDKAEIFASNIPFNEFYHSASMAGILKDGNPLATWYRGISKGKISIEIKSIKYKGFNPRYPELWKLGDSIENLDIPLTLSNNPIIVPNITTKKWNKELEFGMSISKTIPDLLLVLDSSGSMKWNYAAPKKNSRGSFHSAVIASFATIQHAIGKGAKCNVINFSNIATTTSWTTDLDILEQEILQYKGSGTILPIEDIFKACNLVDGKVLVVIISDFALHNLADSKKFMYEIIAQDHFLVGFFITNKFNKNKYNEVFRELNLYLINDPRDLENLVINNIQKYYT